MSHSLQYARRYRITHDALRDSLARIPAAERQAAIAAASRRYSWQAGIIAGAALVGMVALYALWWAAQ